MTEFALSDHIRATPSRTVGALLVAAVRFARAELRRRIAERAPPVLSDRALADIGMSRWMLDLSERFERAHAE